MHVCNCGHNLSGGEEKIDLITACGICSVPSFNSHSRSNCWRWLMSGTHCPLAEVVKATTKFQNQIVETSTITFHSIQGPLPPSRL